MFWGNVHSIGFANQTFGKCVKQDKKEDYQKKSSLRCIVLAFGQRFEFAILKDHIYIEKNRCYPNQYMM